MIGFIYNNQFLVIVIALILFLIILYSIIKKLPTKVEKKEQKKENKTEQKKTEESKPEKKVQEKTEEKPEVNQQEQSEEKTQNQDKISKKEQKKPKIVQVFKRERKNIDGDNTSKIIDDPIYNRNVEFVNTSKNISKFKSFVDDKKETEEKNVDEFGFVTDEQDDCEFCEDKVKHFDHSKRLSSIMKNDSDLFASHISDKYLNVNAERHLKSDEMFSKELYSMTDKMMSNSDNKLQGDVELRQYNHGLFYSNPNESEERADTQTGDDDINIRNIIYSDIIMNRKKKK